MSAVSLPPLAELRHEAKAIAERVAAAGRHL